MIAGTGVDIIEIVRFAHWHNYPRAQLRKIYSESEIAYCLTDTQKSAQRFAVRFALREALFKAVRVAMPENSVPFLTLCKAITLQQTPQTPPKILVHWQALHIAEPAYTVHISLSHSKTMAIAQVILEEQQL